MKPTLVCLCGHVEGSHKEGHCKTCDCREFKSAIPVFFALPPGVVYVKTYRSGLSLVRCEHANEHQRPTGGWAGFPGPDARKVGVMRDPLFPPPELDERAARAWLPPGFVLDYGGELLCLICKGTEFTTDCFRMPVQKLAVVPEEARALASLF